MPFASLKQNAWAHTLAGLKALGGTAKVKEWQDATDYRDLPKRAPMRVGGKKHIVSRKP